VSNCWQFHLFGQVRVVGASEDGPLRLSPLSQSLLAYLLLNRDHRVSRQSVIDAFWRDQPEQRGRRSLATALWRLRRSLEGADHECDTSAPRPESPLQVGDTSIRIDRNCWVDVVQFERTARSILAVPPEQATTHAIRGLQDAVALYRGDLLEEHADEWAVRERERYQLLLQDCLAYLLRHYAQHGAWDEALGYGAMLLEQDVLREDIHREMMRLYARSGRRALAMRQYEACRAVLATELGVAPMDETQRLMDWVTGTSAEEPLAPTRPSLGDLEEMLQTALDAQRALQVVIDELRRQRTWTNVGAPVAGAPPAGQWTPREAVRSVRGHAS